MRTILPALADFHYRGCSDYLDDVLAQIDTPRLENLRIKYFVDNIRASSQLSRFINRTDILRIDQFRRMEVGFFSEDTYIVFDCPRGDGRQAQLSIKILDMSLGWLEMQIPGVVNILGQLAAVFPKVDQLVANGDHVASVEIGLAEWLPFFSLFPAVESLNLSGRVAPYIASALEDNADSEVVADVFSALHLIWLDEDEYEDEDEPVGSIEQFLSSRQLSGRPVTVVNTQEEFLNADQRPL